MPAAQQMLLAHPPTTLPRMNEDPWIILAVEYSVRWFSVGLYQIDDFGIVDPIEGAVRGRRIDEGDQLHALRDSLSHLFAYNLPGTTLSERIHHLVVYGDDAKNDDLNRVLVELLGADLVRDADVSRSILMAYRRRQALRTSVWTRQISKCTSRLPLAADGAPACMQKMLASCKQCLGLYCVSADWEN